MDASLSDLLAPVASYEAALAANRRRLGWVASDERILADRAAFDELEEAVAARRLPLADLRRLVLAVEALASVEAGRAASYDARSRLHEAALLLDDVASLLARAEAAEAEEEARLAQLPLPWAQPQVGSSRAWEAA